MGSARSLAPVLLLLLLAPSTQAAWDQPGGSASRDGSANLGALDVVAQFDMGSPDAAFVGGPAGLLDTGHGLVTLGRSGAECVLSTIPYEGGDATATSRIPCPLGARLAAWVDPYAIVCVAGSYLDPLLQAWAPGASEAAWTRVPSMAAPDPSSLLTTAGQDANTWTCEMVAADAAQLFVAFASTTGRNRIEALSATDGEAAWSMTIPSSAFLQGVNASVLPVELLDASGAFRAQAVTLTDSGLLVTGRLDGTQVADAPPGAAWLTRDGELRGAFVTSTGPGTPATTNQPSLLPMSRWPAARGNLAATLIGDGVFAVDPRLSQGTVTQVGNPSLGQNSLAAPCWSRDHLVVPGEAAAFVMPSTDPSAFVRWPGLQGGRIQACAIQETTAWMLLTRDENGPRSDLVLVDTATAQSLLQVPLPLAPSDPRSLVLGLLPLAGGRLLAYDGSGAAVLLAPEPSVPLPVLGTDDAYPGAQAPALVTTAYPPGAPNGTRLHLAWGDGRLELAPPERYSHTYGEGGDRTVRLTAVYPDNRTATTSLILHVGAAPPPPKTWLDVLLAPENQNYTFTGLGILITVATAIVGAVGVHRGRHRLERHMRALDRLHEAGRRDPFAAVHDLHEFREARRFDMAKGNLDQGQFTVLEGAADRALQILRQRILGNYVGRVSDHFSHRLDVALADGALDDEEARELAALVEKEKALGAGDRHRLGELVKAWNKAI